MPCILQDKELLSKPNQSHVTVCRTLGIALMKVVKLFMKNIF